MAADILLVAMPWEMLEMPSIQLGTLEALLRREGLPVRSRSSKLPFWDRCLAATRDDPEPLEIGDYDHVALAYWRIGLGDWIFHAAPDGRYLDHAREQGVPEAWIRKAQRVRELVPAFLDGECDAILAGAPEIVGFTTTFNQTLPSVALARRIRERAPATRIVFGGANCDGPMGEALLRTFGCIDAVVRGEAEMVLPGLVKEMLEGRSPTRRAGLAFREKGEIVVVPESNGERVAMDDVPLPDYAEYFERLATTSFHGAVRPFVTLLYESGRGCWWGERSTCTFCGLNGLNMAFRSKTPERVVGDLDELVRRHRRLSFQIVDNIVAPAYFDELMPRLLDAGHDYGFFLETKTNLTWRQVAAMRDAGVGMVQAGIESLSTPILKLMRKGVTALQNIRTLVYSARAGIRCYWNLLYGFPGEPESEYERMAALVPAFSHLEPPTPSLLRLDRFSPYHADPAAFDIKILGPSPHYAMLFPEAAPDRLADLAYTFDYRLPHGQDPARYAAPLLEAVARWQRGHASSVLSSRRGPAFLLIDDRREGLEPAFYTLGPLGRRIYEACEHGATAERVWNDVKASGGAPPSLRQVEGFLAELARLHLAYEERGRYLSLAIPRRARAAVPEREPDRVPLEA